ncbi:MAG: AAA family ATPase, partial [Actinomycetota bacterium]
GRLTDAQGRTVDFKNTVIIMTSNLGSQHLLVSESEEAAAEKVMATVRDHFKPEFLNRVDEILVFHRLNQEELTQIVDIQLAELQRRLSERSITLVIDDEAKRYLATAGYDPAYGARPLKRLIQRAIENPLALQLLDGTFVDGETIEVGAQNGGLVFTKASEAPVPQSS